MVPVKGSSGANSEAFCFVWGGVGVGCCWAIRLGGRKTRKKPTFGGVKSKKNAPCQNELFLGADRFVSDLFHRTIG